MLLREMPEERLTPEGFEVLVTGDPAVAVKLVLDQQPDVAVLDIDMPGGATFDVAEVPHAESPNTRVVFLSGYVRDACVEKALAI
jgi:CheY-like chemotaxis protein